jgi:ATP-binding cassette, subfamily B, bacterial
MKRGSLVAIPIRKEKKGALSYRNLFSFLWKFMRPQKWTFASILFQDCLGCLDSLLWPFLLRWVIDIFSRYEGSRALAWESLQVPIIASICVIVFFEINARTMGFLMAKAIPKLQSDIRMAMFDHVQRHSPHYFNERLSGSLVNKITDMTTCVESILQQLFWPIVSSIATSVLATLFLWFVHPILSVILILWIAIHLGVCLMFSKKCDLYEHQHGESRSTLLGKIVDSLTNYFAVNLFYRFKYEKNALSPFQKEEEKTNVFARKYVEKMRSVTSFFYATICFLGINGFVVYLWLHHHITTGVDAPILILDEATSSLDSVTEKYIQDSLKKLMQNCTTIVIAHRLSTLSYMDRILVFDQGEIVEEGTHTYLLSKGGLYARMWNMQVGGFLPETPA